MSPTAPVPRVGFTEGLLRIRPIEIEDSELFLEALRESWESARRWMSWGDGIVDLASARAHVALRRAEWDQNEAFSFVIGPSAGTGFWGMCGLSQCNWRHGFANVGYWVRPSRKGRNIAPAAVRLLARFGFDALKLNRVEIVIEPANYASQRVAEKTGARLEGRLRSRIVHHGPARDALMFSLIPEDLG